MSADSPRRGTHKGAQVVSPQPIVDRSIIDSVAGIINDIVPQAYSGAPNADNKESISWARFEYADVNDPALYPDYNEGSSTPPLLLVLGYATGVQVWLIAATGEATEVLSWRQGVVRTLRILPSPKTDEEHTDPFERKRPMVAICDSAGPGPQFCNVSFISLKTGEQTKSIKFKSPVSDILANRRSIAVTFLEKIAVFDARTLDDVLSITTCYASPGPNPNPVALGTRWLAYSEKKLLPAKRSSGGCEGDGVQSYTATVLYAAKSLGKGLRGLGETVASSLTGNTVPPMSLNNMGNDITQPGVVTILDLHAAKEEKESDDGNVETVIAHFTAHSDAIVAMTFDLTGALLMTADKRGHDFHIFRIQPHPGGPTLAAVHHLYILHRGDTTAKVQDMVFSSDTRWAAVSTVRGTTHVFPVAPYGGPVGVRTHSTPHVVNRLSRFHRSAGLTDDGTRSHSPVSHAELPLSVYPYSNPRLPPYPHPTVLHPLAQIRQPSSLSHTHNQSQTSRPQQRQRLHSDDSGTLPLKICACFAPPRAWIYAQRESSSKVTKRAVDSLFIMACHGNMIQYDLEPKPAAGVPKEKVCDDTMIELDVEAKGQWPLLRSPNSVEIVPPLPPSSPLLNIATVPESIQQLDTAEDRWLSQVEIVTHAGPHRRLWMGPQFVFKTYNAPSGVGVNLVEAEAVEIGVTGGSRPARSNPVNMPHAASRPLVPVVIDGSGSSYEQSPRFMEAYGDPLNSENMAVGSGENQLREDLAEAMLETSVAPHRAPGRRSVFERVGQPVTKVVNPLGTVITVSADEEDVSSSQEFDSAEENLMPEGPRSVCAEEGPASLGDLEPESQTLRDLTEICAEMRSASEPAIDSVPDDSIREVQEKRAICAEIATADTAAAAAAPVSGRRASIDFGREESFRDVPTSLSLCAEKGEIPSSPMTQAKEHAWAKLPGKRDNDVEAHERNLAKAKYVVNYDEDSVVLMENRVGRFPPLPSRKEEQTSAQKSAKPSCHAKKSLERENTGKAQDKVPPASNKRENKARTEKYIVKEQGDSVVIEDTRDKNGRKKGSSAKVEKKDQGGKPEERAEAVETTQVKCEEVKSRKTRISEEQDLAERSNVAEEKQKSSQEVVESFEELRKVEDAEKLLEEKQSQEEEVKDQPSDSQPSDDFSSIDYHIVESSCPTNSSNHSDDDIEHINSSELTQICAEGNDKKSERSELPTSCSETSPSNRRKSSKSTISDDDLEYIQNSELVDKEPIVAAVPPVEKVDSCPQVRSRRHSKYALSSDDDLEHVQYADICEADPPLEDSPEKVGRKLQEASVEQASKVKATRKKKDIVVIESDASESEVTVIVKPVDKWVKNKLLEKDVAEETETGSEQKGKSTDEETSGASPARKSKVKSPKNAQGAQKRPQTSAIEIIDIDAMQKAEMKSSAESSALPECKILSPRYETRTKKLRKNRRSQSDVASGQDSCEPSSSCKSPKARMAELREAAEELLVDSKWQESKAEAAVAAETSWSAIVKKKSASSSENSESRKETDLEPLIEVEERSECGDSKILEAHLNESEVRDTSSLGRGDSREARRSDSKAVEQCNREAELPDGGTENSLLVDLSVPPPTEGSPGRIRKDRKAATAAQQQDVPSKQCSQQRPRDNESEKLEPPALPLDSTSSKENSPEPERETESEKRSDSEQEVVPERSSSSDELNSNLPATCVDEDSSARDHADKNVVNGTTSGAPGAGKKGNRFRKKKRR